MIWTPKTRKGAAIMAGITIAFTLFSLAFLWFGAGGMDLAPWDFFKMAVIVAIVWAAIGAVMTFFIVMILRKNEGRGG